MLAQCLLTVNICRHDDTHRIVLISSDLGDPEIKKIFMDVLGHLEAKQKRSSFDDDLYLLTYVSFKSN